MGRRIRKLTFNARGILGGDRKLAGAGRQVAHDVGRDSRVVDRYGVAEPIRNRAPVDPVAGEIDQRRAVYVGRRRRLIFAPQDSQSERDGNIVSGYL